MQLTQFRRRDLDPLRMIRDLERDFPRWPWAGWPFEKGGKEGWSPSVDVYDEDGAVVVKAEVPGLSKDEVHVKVEAECLIIEGERRTETEKKDKDYYFCEREYGSFYRRIPLPARVDAAKAEAHVKDGVLTVKVPRAEPAPEAKQIPIT
jgi:HSP20 family protein